jgi:hypothetical protein
LEISPRLASTILAVLAQIEAEGAEIAPDYVRAL